MMVQYLTVYPMLYSVGNEVHVVPSGRHRAAGISRPVSVPGSQLTHRTTAFGVHLLCSPYPYCIGVSTHQQSFSRLAR